MQRIGINPTRSVNIVYIIPESMDNFPISLKIVATRISTQKCVCSSNTIPFSDRIFVYKFI